MPSNHKPPASSTSSSFLVAKIFEGDANGNGGHLTRKIGQSFTERRMTTEWTLPPLTDHEVGLPLNADKAFSIVTSPQSAPKSRSPGGPDHWPSSAVPLPLPLPETPLACRPELTGSNSRPNQLGSPPPLVATSVLIRKEANSTALISAKSSSTYRGINSQELACANSTYSLKVSIPAPSLTASDFSTATAPPKSQFRDLSSPNVAVDGVKHGNTNRRKLSQDVDNEYVGRSLSLHVSPKSAPTSVFTSPTNSPRRSGNFDLSALSSGVLQLSNTEYSPTNQNRRLSLKGQEGIATSQRQKSLPDIRWSEINDHVDAYPLPLPPNATSPVQSSLQPLAATTYHHLESPFDSPMKGQWQKGKLIGRGTFGNVYLATNRKTGASCAMKEVDLIPDDPKSAECIKQLEQEIKVLHRLKHQNIVQYLGSEIIDDRFYIYLEYVHPGSINKFIREHSGAITESIVRNFTRHVLAGLAYLHANKTIHRDIKGANLLVDGSGTVKLADFGMAKILNGQSYDLSLKGSPYWMAPEVIEAAILKDASPDLAFAVDIWSLGCTIIEMFTGKPPWSEYEGPQAMFKVLHTSPPIPETLSPNGQDFLQQCFQRDPAKRPSAVVLLEHPFVCNLQQQNANAIPHSRPSPKQNEMVYSNPLQAKSPSPRESAKQINELLSAFRGTQILNRHLDVGGDDRPFKAQESNCVEPCCKFPQLVPEVHPTKHSLEYFVTSPDDSSNMLFNAIATIPLPLKYVVS